MRDGWQEGSDRSVLLPPALPTRALRRLRLRVLGSRVWREGRGRGASGGGAPRGARERATKRALTAFAHLLTLLPITPQVDDRLAGEGTGKALGISGAEGWAVPIVFALIWSLYYGATRELGDGPSRRGSGDDSGLSL